MKYFKDIENLQNNNNDAKWKNQQTGNQVHMGDATTVSTRSRTF